MGSKPQVFLHWPRDEGKSTGLTELVAKPERPEHPAVSLVSPSAERQGQIMEGAVCKTNLREPNW